MPAPRSPRPPAVAYLLLAAGVLLCIPDGLPRWVGAATVITALPEVLGPRVDTPFVRQLRRRLPLLLVGAVAAALLGELLVGHPPASRDHGIHYFQTRLLVEDFITHGRLSGWSERFNNGYPFLESYPALGYVVTGAARLVSLGLVSLRTSYAWGILAVWVLGAASVWWLAATLVRELGGGNTDSRWAAAAAALLFLLDAGTSRQGGWTYAMFHGVWPQTLSAALWVLSIPLTLRALQRPSPRRMAVAGLVLGSSVLAHPFGILAAATSAGGWCVALLLARDADGLSTGRLKIWAVIHIAAALVAGGWVAMFLGSADSMAREPVPWMPLGALAVDAVRGALLTTQLLWAGPLAVIGVVAVLTRCRVTALLVVGVLAALLVLGSHEAIAVLRLDLLVSGFKNLQFPRYAIEIKPLLFALAGVGAWLVPRALRRLGTAEHDDSGSPPGAGSRRRRFTVALVLAPLIVAGAEDVGRLATRPVGALDTLENSDEAEAERDLLAALRAEATDRNEPLRVAFMREGMGGGTYPLFSITDSGADLVLDGHVPTVNFKHRLARRAAAYRALGVTHVIHDRDLRASESDVAERLDPIGTFGSFHLARWTDRAPAPLVRGPAGVDTRVDILGVERWDIHVSGGEFPARLILARAPHLRWEPTIDGAPLEHDFVRKTPGLPQMAITVDRPGTIELRYRRSHIESTARWLSWITLLIAAAALSRGQPLALADRLLAPARRRWYEAIALVLAVGLVGTAWRRQNRQLRTTWTEAAAELDNSGRLRHLERDLVVEDAVTVTTDPPRICDGLLGKSTLPGCSETDHRPHRSMLHREPYLYRCLQVSVPPGGTTRVEFDAPDARVLGMLLRVTGAGRGKGLDYDAGEGHTRMGRNLRTFSLPGVYSGPAAVELRNRGTIVERVCVAAAAFSN